MSGEWLVPSAAVAALGQELILAGGGTLLLLLDAFVPRLQRLFVPAGLLVVVAAVLTPAPAVESSAFGGLLVANELTWAFGGVVLVSTAIALLASNAFLRRKRLPAAEYVALLLWCATGMLLMIRAAELLTVFVALELFSICLYALAAWERRNAMSTEAAIKYFLMGAFVSSFVLYGIALVYGATGTTRLAEMASILGQPGGLSVGATLGLLLLVAGFGFKMSVVPFHAWAPDAYQGAPAPFVAFLSVAPKVAAVVVMIRLVEIAVGAPGSERWQILFGSLAALSMILGNVLALVQRDIKRMLAYSGIAHMGYVLIPLAAWSADGWWALLVYLLAYALMNGGAFAIVAALYERTDEPHLISNLSGWAYRFPGMALALTVCMLSLGGIPPTLGFLGKYVVFAYAIANGQLWLAVVGVATSLLGVFYYLRVVYALYMQREEVEPSRGVDPSSRLAAWLTAGALLVLGIVPPLLAYLRP